MTKPDSRLRSDRLAVFLDPPDALAAFMIVLSAAYLATALAPAGAVRAIWGMFELAPARALEASARGDYFAFARAFLGHLFFHVNLAHLLVNLMAILIAGGLVYREMSASGRTRKSDVSAAFIAFLLLCGMFAGLGYVAAAAGSYRPMIGASGAAAGLVGACVWIAVTRNGEGALAGGRLRNAGLLFVVSAFVISLSFLLDTSAVSRALFGSVSAWQAHISGYLFGLGAYPLFERLAHAGKER